MPPKRSLNLSNLKTNSLKRHNTDKKQTQVTISKFFASKDDIGKQESVGCIDSDQIVIDDTEDDDKDTKTVHQVPTSLSKKRSREGDTEADSRVKKVCHEPQLSACLQPEIRPSTSDGFQKEIVLSSATKQKLQTFSVSEQSNDVEGVSNFDFCVLKREKAAYLPDINDSATDTEVGNEADGNSQEDMEIKEIQDNVARKLSGFTAVPTSSSSAVSSDRKKSSGKLTLKAGAVKYTQLEQQYVDIKAKYPDALLFVECGYKYRFFGDDAEIAARVLKIYCHLDHNFMTASIPVHRLFVHTRRLVAAGYKVGVVKQMETAALKAAGSNRNTPFSRQLTALYTKSTLIGQDVDPLSGETVAEDNTGATATNTYLMCICDTMPGKRPKTNVIGMVTVQPATGDVIYDCFEDTDTRSELETRISHIQPVEILMSQEVTSQSERIITGLQMISDNSDDRMRLEKLDPDVFEYNKAFKAVSQFYQNIDTNKGSSHLQEIVNLPHPTICCLSALITYLSDFNLDKVLHQVSNFTQFSMKSKYMQLNGNTVRNLELFTNGTDGRERGSLFWALNQTQTKPGSRLLRTWIARPLLCKSDIVARQDAIAEIQLGVAGLEKLKNILIKLPDLERGLCSIYHKKCSPGEFYTVCKSLETVQNEVLIQRDALKGSLISTLLQIILEDIPRYLDDIKIFSQAVHEKAAREDDKTHLFVDESQFPIVVKRKNEISAVLQELQGHRREVRLLLRQPALEFTTVLGTEFLIEVKNSLTSTVPSDWTKIGSTKAVSRYHSPFIEKKYKQLNQLREQLTLDCTEAWMSLLDLFGGKFQCYRKAVQQLATLDCLFSLATVGHHHGYCRPELVEGESCIEINQGRHPVIQQLLGEQEQYVPNDTQMQVSGERVMIITGPNMGGKSSYIKQTAILTIMAQIGSFLPADSARLGILDAVYTRMGAADEIFKGRSTFMVELQEASDIISAATSQSLVIMDELGRGTSTHDGVAIAYATLNYFIQQTKCLTLFVTHYPMLAELEDHFPGCVGNYHMSFLLHDSIQSHPEEERSDDITFLYQLVPGMAHRSYGLNVAKLANIPTDIVKVATEKSGELEHKVQTRRNDISLFEEVFRAENDKISDLLLQYSAHSRTEDAR